MLREEKSLSGLCHGNGMTITVSLWLCDFYVIKIYCANFFWHSEKVTYQIFYWACMILKENANYNVFKQIAFSTRDFSIYNYKMSVHLNNCNITNQLAHWFGLTELDKQWE